MTRHERHTSITCLLGSSETGSSVDGRNAISLDMGIIAGIYHVSDLGCVGQFEALRCAPGVWTHLYVVINPSTDRHPENAPALHEDPLLNGILTQAQEGMINAPLVRLGDAKIRLYGLTSNTRATWEVLDAVLDDAAYCALRSRFLEICEQVRSPYPVVKTLTGYGLAAETYLVWYRSSLAVCKMFRSGFEARFRREVDGLQTAERVGVGPSLYEVGPNFVVMEYLCGHKPLSTTWYGLVELEMARHVFEAIALLHNAGIALFDLKFENVLSDGNDVRVIDFETSMRYQDPVPTFDKSPLFTWKRFVEYGKMDAESQCDPIYDSLVRNGPYITYGTNWEPHIGLDIHRLMNGRPYRVLRLWHLLSNKVYPRFFGRLTRGLRSWFNRPDH